MSPPRPVTLYHPPDVTLESPSPVSLQGGPARRRYPAPRATSLVALTLHLPPPANARRRHADERARPTPAAPTLHVMGDVCQSLGEVTREHLAPTDSTTLPLCESTSSLHSSYLLFSGAAILSGVLVAMGRSESLIVPAVARVKYEKSRQKRAYPQQIVTTRLLYCLQDPFAQLSRLQRI